MEADGALDPRRSRWRSDAGEQARQQLTGILAEHESPDALEGMGTALWWLGDIHESLNSDSARTRAIAPISATPRPPSWR